METPAGEEVSYGFVRCGALWDILPCQFCGKVCRACTWRQSLRAIEFLPMQQPYMDALPHLILIKAPKGTSYNPTRRAYGHNLRSHSQQVSGPSQTKVLTVFSTVYEAWETEPGVSKVPSSTVIPLESTCGCGWLLFIHSSLTHINMSACDSVPHCDLPLDTSAVLCSQLNIL